MNKLDLKQFINELQQADVTISHVQSKTILSYNGLNDPSQLNKQLLQQNCNAEDIATKYLEYPDLINLLDHYADTYQKRTDNFFPIINNYVTTRSLYINDNLHGHIQFKNLDEDLQEKISLFAQIQKEYFLLFLDILRSDKNEKTKTNYPYIFNSTSTNLVTTLMSIFASNHFITPGDESLNKLTTFINLTCDQLNISRINNLNSVISNIKKKASPDQTLQELADNLLKLT